VYSCSGAANSASEQPSNRANNSATELSTAILDQHAEQHNGDISLKINANSPDTAKTIGLQADAVPTAQCKTGAEAPVLLLPGVAINAGRLVG
jgi:hypothetical protein